MTCLNINLFIFIACFTPLAQADDYSIAVFDFELNDLTIHDDDKPELERTATIKPYLEQALSELGSVNIVSVDIEKQKQADRGRGYLFEHIDLAAELGRDKNARWVAIGRVHKPSYLFVYLKVKLVDTQTDTMAADLIVELKGQRDKFVKKGVHRLAVQIKEAINHYVSLQH